MLNARFLTLCFSAGLIVLGANLVSGQAYPSKPVRLWTAPAGGDNDFLTRIIAQGIAGPLGQPVIVENRNQLVSAEAVAKAAPDGYNVMYGGGYMLTPITQKVTFDPVKDFATITIASTHPLLLVVHPSLPVKSVKDLIALAKARPGELNFAAGAVGVAAHLAGALLKTMAGVDFAIINYAGGGGPAVRSVISGETQMHMAALGIGKPHVQSGRLKQLGLTSLQPSALAPEIPTVASTGLPGFEVLPIDVIVAPAGTPAAIINQLNREILRVLNMPSTKEKFTEGGNDIMFSTPAEADARVKAHIAKFTKVAADAGIKPK